ncbi:MAG: methylenetetrahydrofolate reductase [Bacteroidaceae bacterium]|nr:methylenetetrahydrofolate reductase [Candidatus Colenecus caballi]MCQ2073368.1 methylenetetrahydrofolate reductase [Bacteroidaceae bacterium]
MKISDILAGKKTLSFEIFPPKREEDTFTLIEKTIKQMDTYSPDFISVTYGALGNTLSNTASIARHIKENTKSEPLAHFTCVASDYSKVDSVCTELKNYGVENILTLRGDMPKDVTTPVFSDFKHSSQMAQYIAGRFPGDFCMAGACYPEKHPESENMRKEIEYMKIKQDAGMSFFNSQLFFDNEVFYHFLLQARKAGVTAPIIPGIMPVSNYAQLDRMIQITGCNVPLKLRNYFDRYKDDKAALEEIGIIFTSYQILDLMANDVDGIHIYSMNKSSFIAKLMDNIGYVATEFFK